MVRNFRLTDCGRLRLRYIADWLELQVNKGIEDRIGNAYIAFKALAAFKKILDHLNEWEEETGGMPQIFCGGMEFGFRVNVWRNSAIVDKFGWKMKSLEEGWVGID